MDLVFVDYVTIILSQLHSFHHTPSLVIIISPLKPRSQGYIHSAFLLLALIFFLLSFFFFNLASLISEKFTGLFRRNGEHILNGLQLQTKQNESSSCQQIEMMTGSHKLSMFKVEQKNYHSSQNLIPKMYF